jgi:hypothetical protein
VESCYQLDKERGRWASVRGLCPDGPLSRHGLWGGKREEEMGSNSATGPDRGRERSGPSSQGEGGRVFPLFFFFYFKSPFQKQK